MENKILLSILMILPFVSGVGAVFYTKNFLPKDLEWILVVGSVIPFVNIFFAIALLVLLLLKKI